MTLTNHGSTAAAVNIQAGTSVSSRLNSENLEFIFDSTLNFECSAPAAAHGDFALSPDQVPVPLILGVNCDSRVPQDGLRPSGRHRQVLAAATRHRVPEEVQRARILRVVHLHCPSLAQRIPDWFAWAIYIAVAAQL